MNMHYVLTQWLSSADNSVPKMAFGNIWGHLVLEQWGRGACATDIQWVEVSDAKHSTTHRTVFETKNYPAERSMVPRLGDPENHIGTYSDGETGLGRQVPLQAALARPPD